MGRRSIAAGIGLLAALSLPASLAGAGTEAPAPEPTTTAEPTTSDDELGAEFDAELSALLTELGVTDDPATLLGEAGDLDLPSGEPVYLGLVAATADEELPDGGASELAGPCQGVAISLDGDGAVVDAASDFSDAAPPVDLLDGGQAFTADNPFEVDVDGYVVYAGRAEPAPINHTWAIETLGISFDSGGDDNPDAEDRNAGTVNLADDLPAPAKVNALFRIEGDMDADDGFRCQGSGYIATVGGAPVLEAAGLVLVLLGGLGLLFNARPAKTWKA